jgi:hypothetical protein
MDRQEAAFQGWLNAVLVPAAPEGTEECSSDGKGTHSRQRALASRRFEARLRGLLWQLYSQDAELIRWAHSSSVHMHMPLTSQHSQRVADVSLHTLFLGSVMLKVEQRVTAGQLRLKEPVSIPQSCILLTAKNSVSD